MMKTAVASLVKNAENRVAEWVAYHSILGFDTLILLENASTDNTAAVLDRICATGLDVRVISWPMTGSTYQIRGLEWAIWRFRNEFDWIACFDVDEFLVLPKDRTLQSLLSVSSNVSIIVAPWAVFGSNGLVQSPKFVIPAFDRRTAETTWDDYHIKSIVRPGDLMRIYNPHIFEVSGRIVDMSGSDLIDRSPVQKRNPNYIDGQLNHYFVQSRSDWEAKNARGYHDGPSRPWSEFDASDCNEIEDRQALDLWPDVEKLLRGWHL
jgi:hypothetical protein